MSKLTEQMQAVLAECEQKLGLRPGQILVLGCSTSEVMGKRIGTDSSLEVAKALFPPLQQFVDSHQLCLAVQCCEHLNRALVVTRECQERHNLVEVSAVPHPGAGGAMSTVAYARTPDAVLVESIQAHAGIDIGDVLIGMHLRPVAVPVRLSQELVGEARVTAAKTRPRLIGGERAKYKREDGVLKSCL
ncbi:MAG: TIGR01440 family protein [Bacillota bacterium]